MFIDHPAEGDSAPVVEIFLPDAKIFGNCPGPEGAGSHTSRPGAGSKLLRINIFGCCAGIGSHPHGFSCAGAHGGSFPAAAVGSCEPHFHDDV